MHIFHDSQDTDFRSPFGAAEVGSEVSLAVFAPEAVSAVLHSWSEAEGDLRTCMSKGSDGFFRATLRTPDTGCLIWYYFILEKPSGGIIFYGNARDGLGGAGAVYESAPKAYQISIYKHAPVPKWYKDAVVYQIFPDRFFPGSGKGLTEDWYKVPEYEKDAKGNVTRWDFYGGTLEGIREKLPYLSSLGISAIYLNPIFKARSNHRYDTADYMKIDPRLGTDEDFTRLAEDAAKRGISLILDGVFSHTGADSVYFDIENRYGNGAYFNEDSPYRSWFRFDSSEPSGYKCWWGVTDLPEVNEDDSSYREFICGENGVIKHWLRAGAKGFRLDVADELPDSFIKDIRRSLKAVSEENVLIGEVWEDASNKVSHGENRKYLMGEELDGVMNYPFRDMVLDFIDGSSSGSNFDRRMRNLMENYPHENFMASLQLIGSHDRERALTLFGAEKDPKLAKDRLKLASALQYTCPGVPCIYYGDEAGLTGKRDPENRAGYPWGREDEDLIAHYRMLGLIYREHSALKGGDYISAYGEIPESVCAFIRKDKDEKILVLANRSTDEALHVAVETGEPAALQLFTSEEFKSPDGKLKLMLPPLAVYILLLGEKPKRSYKLEKSAGILCPVYAIPGEGARSNIGRDARAFVDYIASAGFKLWQILPLAPLGLGNSPYYSPAVFAGEPSYIDPDELPGRSGLESFKKENSYWLEDYVSFFEGSGRTRGQLEFEQYCFFTQWEKLKDYANSKGISIVGDLPFYPAPGGADVSAHPELFLLDEDGSIKVHAGVPPDYFSGKGQDWGNPLYDWAAMEADGWRWWVERLRTSMKLYDYVRIDHFRALSSYFAIPEGKEPKDGLWMPGPRAQILRCGSQCLPGAQDDCRGPGFSRLGRKKPSQDDGASWHEGLAVF